MKYIVQKQYQWEKNKDPNVEKCSDFKIHLSTIWVDSVYPNQMENKTYPAQAEISALVFAAMASSFH